MAMRIAGHTATEVGVGVLIEKGSSEKLLGKENQTALSEAIETDKKRTTATRKFAVRNLIG